MNRAVYFDADIYLLDDPLSAVDSHVGRHLFDSCIMQHLKHKVRILVTHQLQFLKSASQILILKEVRGVCACVVAGVGNCEVSLQLFIKFFNLLHVSSLFLQRLVSSPSIALSGSINITRFCSPIRYFFRSGNNYVCVIMKHCHIVFSKDSFSEDVCSFV